MLILCYKRIPEQDLFWAVLINEGEGGRVKKNHPITIESRHTPAMVPLFRPKTASQVFGQRHDHVRVPSVRNIWHFVNTEGKNVSERDCLCTEGHVGFSGQETSHICFDAGESHLPFQK